MNFAQRFKELRKSNKKTQEEIAKILSVSKSTVAMWETDKRTPDFDKTKEIADYFNVNLDYLMGRESEKQEMIHEKILLTQQELAMLQMYRNKDDDEQIRKLFELLAFYNLKYTESLEEQKNETDRN